MRLPQLAALRGGIMTRTFAARGRPGPAMYVAAALIAGAGLAAVPAAAAASAATGARPAQAPSSLCPGENATSFGANVCVFSDTMSQATIQTDLDNIASQQVPVASQFSSQRYAIFFQPGTYGSAADPLVFQVGYYTEVAGLGSLPQDTVINGAIDVFNNLCTAGTSSCNSDDNFWRSLSNLDLNVDLPSSPPAYAPPVLDPSRAGCANSAEIWSASQASPIRRAIVNGNVVFQDYCAANNFASGGFIADSKVSGALDFYGNQQYMVRNSDIGGANGCPQGVWNMVPVPQHGHSFAAHGGLYGWPGTYWFHSAAVMGSPLLAHTRLVRVLASISQVLKPPLPPIVSARSEERRVGEEGRSRWSPHP